VAAITGSGYSAIMNIAVPHRMTVDEFLAWSSRQEKGRYELQDGRVIMQQSQNMGHLKAKGRIFTLVQAAITRSGLPIYVVPDGATVRIAKSTTYEPDALVALLPMPDDSSLEISNPVIVVEVLSPSSIKRDLIDKLAGYFQVPSIMHYLVLDPEEKVIIWHRRAAAGGLEPPVKLETGILRLDPPGLEIDVAALFG
jgi:Uma2 family endonuclease